MVKKTFYDVLQVSRNADPEIIKAAYKSIVQRYPPDKNSDNPDAEKHLKIINRAYEVLSDPVKRAGYDAALAEDDEDRINQADAATPGNESEKSQTASHAEDDFNKTTERAAPFDRSSTLTKKRDYIWMIDIMPGLALGQLCSKWLLTAFHGSPEASGWMAAISLGVGGAVGFVLCNYLRTQATKNMQKRGNVILVSIFISLGLMLTIVTTTVFLTKSAPRFDPKSFVPDAPSAAVPANPFSDPNFGADLVHETPDKLIVPDSPIVAPAQNTTTDDQIVLGPDETLIGREGNICTFKWGKLSYYNRPCSKHRGW